MPQPRSKTATILITLALLSAALLLAFYLTKSNGPKSIPVDFEQLAPMVDDTPTTPALRVAVAAMISPQETRKYYHEFLRLLGQRIGRHTEFIQRQTYAEVNELVRNKEVDLAFVCAGPYVTGHDQFGMELLAVPVVHNSKSYYSYIIVNKASGLNAMADLRNKRFAFTDPHSNTGYLVPTYMLAQMGETPESFFAETFFTHSHDNSITAVANGQADGAAVDSLIWEFMRRINPQDTGKTKIITKSPPYGIPPIVVPADLAPGLKEKLRSSLLSIHLDKQTAPLLKKLQIDRFAPGTDAMYDSVRRMDRWLQKQADKKK